MPSDQPYTPAHRSRLRIYPGTAVLTWFLTVFLVLLPKGGIKLGIVPLTWGYMLFAFSLPPLALIRLVGLPLRFRARSLAAFASILPFSLLFYYSYRANGLASPALAFSTLVSLFILPTAFLIVYPAFLHRVDPLRFERLFRFCIFAAAIFGLFLFVFYPITHTLIEIPYLTVNADDYGLIESTKNISRGYFLKLISTYNNGNVYGVATLILLPLYDKLERRLWHRNTLRLALVCTLSRTVWFGLVIDQLFSLLRVLAGAAPTFPRIAFGPVLRRGSIIFATAAAILGGLFLSSGTLAFLFDTKLGGRSAGLTASVHNVTLLPSVPITSFSEIVYAAALSNFGLFGLLSIILIFTFPIALFLCNRDIAHSPLRLAALKGLLIYILVSFFDGAINLIPVMAFYWFAYMVFLEGWPGTQFAATAHSPILQLDPLQDAHAS